MRPLSAGREWRQADERLRQTRLGVPQPVVNFLGTLPLFEQSVNLLEFLARFSPFALPR
jgi:hypothetical protein